jgi:phosphatidylglycerol:prolipoprotein diacylglycerol transferase
MYRILFQGRHITIHAYPAMLYTGLVVGVIGGTFGATLHGLDADRILAALLLLVLPALVGARLLFVASHWEIYRRDPRRIWRRSDGGAALYGGLALSFLLSLPLLRALGISVGAFWDVATITILIGMIFTRVGCLLNGCCAGRPAKGSFALYLPNAQGVWCRRLPTQLLEAGLAVVLLLGSVVVWSRLPFHGALFLCNLALFGIARCGLESTRETVDRIGRLRLDRTISVGLVTLSVASLMFICFLGPVAGWWGSADVPEFTSADELEIGPPLVSEWSFLLAPPAVLAVLLLFRFVGCAAILNIDDVSYVEKPGPTPGSHIPDYPGTILREADLVAFWRLGDTSGPTAKDSVGMPLVSHDGHYDKIPSVLADDNPHRSPKANPITLDIGVTPGILETDATARAMHTRGGFVRVPWAGTFNPSAFTLEALVRPDLDLPTPHRFYCLIESSDQPPAGPAQKIKRGFAIYAGPADPAANFSPTDPASPYYWQLWVGDGTGFKQLIPKGTFTVPGGDAGPKVEMQTTYLAVTFDGGKYFLFVHSKDSSLDHGKYELVSPPPPPSPPLIHYKANDGTGNPGDLFIGIAGEDRNLFGPRPTGANKFLYPFSGTIQEVAIYKGALKEELILGHGMAAFNIT